MLTLWKSFRVPTAALVFLCGASQSSVRVSLGYGVVVYQMGRPRYKGRRGLFSVERESSPDARTNQRSYKRIGDIQTY